MRFMMLMIPKNHGTAPSDPATVRAMMKYNEELRTAGVLLALDSLHPASTAARVTFPGGWPMVAYGLFAEAREVLGGYWMIQVASREEAIEWARRCPGGQNEIVEVRQVQELADFQRE